MIRATDIHSLTDFTRNAKTFIQQIKTTKNPMAITVNGDAEVVIQDAATYQAMVDELERTRFISAIIAGEQNILDGQVQDLDQAFGEIRADLGLQS
jgi:PHD/YefM family antitoxin component YafN of YafNO toxin-antitoxin module